MVLFHSMVGLRLVELSAAERLRTADHRVRTPDLFADAVAADHGSVPAVEDGFTFMDRIGWETIVARARAAVRDLPPDTVLGGFSMGVSVVGSLWPARLAAAGVFQPGGGHGRGGEREVRGAEGGRAQDSVDSRGRVEQEGNREADGRGASTAPAPSPLPRSNSLPTRIPTR